MIRHKLRVWVVIKGRVKFGDGRAQLLEVIDELGSLKKAVAKLGMSYRNAWGYLRELENAAGFTILERGAGGGPASGTRLTRQGRQFLSRYRRFREGVENGAGRQFKKAFRNR